MSDILDYVTLRIICVWNVVYRHYVSLKSVLVPTEEIYNKGDKEFNKMIRVSTGEGKLTPPALCVARLKI